MGLTLRGLGEGNKVRARFWGDTSRKYYLSTEWQFRKEGRGVRLDNGAKWFATLRVAATASVTYTAVAAAALLPGRQFCALFIAGQTKGRKKER